MPVEIKELIVKATVSDSATADAGEGRVNARQKKQIVAEAVEQVLEILKREKER
jgi:hypothetical protein